MCVSTLSETISSVARYSGWAGEEDTHTLAHTLSVVNAFFFCLLAWKDSSGLPSHFKHSCGLRCCLENMSFTLWYLRIYKKTNLTLKIAWLVRNSGRIKQTHCGTQMLVKTTFIFHSDHVTTLLFFDANTNADGCELLLNTDACIWRTKHCSKNNFLRWMQLAYRLIIDQ